MGRIATLRPGGAQSGKMVRRAVNLAAYGEPDAAALAAACGFGLARNHAFVDGNKRTAYVVAEMFLALNGIKLTSSDADGILTFVALAAGDVDEAALGEWFQGNMRVM